MNLSEEFEKIKKGQENILQQINTIKKTANNNRIYSLDELATYFKVTKRTIYNWKDRGMLPCIIIGSKTYVTDKQLENFLTNHQVKDGRRLNYVNL